MSKEKDSADAKSNVFFASDFASVLCAYYFLLIVDALLPLLSVYKLQKLFIVHLLIRNIFPVMKLSSKDAMVGMTSCTDCECARPISPSNQSAFAPFARIFTDS